MNADVLLVPFELEPGLEAYRCSKSGGIWIPLQSYENWKEGYRSGEFPLPPEYVPENVDDGERPALLCPESGCLLVRYRVGHGLKFHLDRSPRTGGVWLDGGEWEALKSKGLHDELHFIFSSSYQHRLARERRETQLSRQFVSRIGEQDFQRVADFATWFREHPRQRDIMAYLLDAAER